MLRSEVQAAHVAEVQLLEVLEDRGQLLGDVIIHAPVLPFRLSGIQVKAGAHPKIP